MKESQMAKGKDSKKETKKPKKKRKEKKPYGGKNLDLKNQKLGWVFYRSRII